MEDYSKQLEIKVKNTVGYNESTQKGHFMSGANVAISKAKEVYEPIIENLKKQVEGWQKCYDKAVADIKQIATTLNYYSGQE